MNTTELIQNISAKNVDVDKFVQLAISEEQARDEIIKQMLAHPDIMVYYHCYYVVAKASQARPELFYRYWPEIASLLKHKNSYHRDMALTIIANLTQVDQGDLFSGIFHDYFEHIRDTKFMTGQCCIQNSLKIYKYKPGLRNQIIALWLDYDQQCAYSEKQIAVLKSDILDIFDTVYAELGDKDVVNEFIKAGLSSISPKTKRRAKELVRKHGL